MKVSLKNKKRQWLQTRNTLRTGQANYQTSDVRLNENKLFTEVVC